MADRKLAAIMFTDIAGYTRLMGMDENKAFEILRINRKIHEIKIRQFDGILVKEMGDGMLASFSSAFDAVKCAIAIQEEAAIENITLRIGIHEADVVFEKGDVLGDGVNVAFRLQEMSDQGGIYISGTVYSEIKNKTSIKTSYIGEKELKNVNEPVKVHKIIYRDTNIYAASDSPPKGGEKNHGKKRNYVVGGILIMIIVAGLIGFYLIKSPMHVSDRQTLEKSIAVRPFWNESPDKGNEYFLNGMTEEIRNNLSKISDLKVISRGSMEKYRESAFSTKEIADELNVNYVLEGTGQKIGDQLVIHIQLIYVSDEENHIWQDEYDREIVDVTDIFIIQREVAEKVANELYATITPKEKGNIKSNSTSDLTAYDFFLQARESHINFWMEGINPVGLGIVSLEYSKLETAIRNYQRALDYDSSFARAYTGLALAYWDEYQNITLFEEDYLDSLLILAEKALSFDPRLDEAYYVRGLYFQKAKGNFSYALSDYQKALDINPNYAMVYHQAGNLYNWELNDYINGFTYLYKAIDLNRGYLLPFTFNTLGQAYLLAGFENIARDYFQRSFEISNDTSGYFWNQAFTEWSKGNIKESIKWAEERLRKDSSDFRILEYLASRYSFVGNPKKSYEYLMKIQNHPNQQDSLYFGHNGNHRIAYIFWENDKKDLAQSYFNLQIKLWRKAIELNRSPSQRGLAQYDLAAIYAFRNQYDSAFYYLKEVEKRETYPAFLITYFKYDPLIKKIRIEPRFKAFLQQAEIKFERTHDELEAWLKDEGLLR